MFKASLIYSLCTIISGFISFIILYILTRNLTQKDFGVVDLIIISALLYNKLVALEVSQSYGRFQADEQFKLDTIPLASTLFNFTLISNVFIFAIAYLYIYFYQLDLIYVSIFAYLFFYSLHYYLLNQYRWYQKPWSYLLIKTAQPIIFVIIIFVIIRSIGITIELTIQSLAVSYALTAFMGFLLSTQNYRMVLDIKILKNALYFSIPLMFASIGLYFNTYTDRYMLAALKGAEQVALYSVATKISTIVTFLLAGVVSSISPVIMQNFARANFKKDLAEYIRVFLLLSIVGLLFLTIFSNYLVVAVSGAQYSDAGKIVKWLVLSIIFASIYNFTPGLIIAKRSWTIMAITSFTCVSNVVLNYLLIPMFEIRGAAFATFLSAFTGAFLYYFLSNKEYKLANSVGLLFIKFSVVCTVILCFDFYMIKFDIFAVMIQVIIVTALILGLNILRLADFYALLNFSKKENGL